MEEETPTDGDRKRRHGGGGAPGEPPAVDIQPSMDRAEILRALDVVERNSATIADSFASLLFSLCAALSEVE